MLELHWEVLPRPLIELRASLKSAGQKNLTNEVIHRRLRSRAFHFRTAHCFIDVGSIAGGHMSLSHVGPVHGETRNDFGKCIAQTFEREIAGLAVPQTLWRQKYS